MTLQWEILLKDESPFPRLLFFSDLNDDRFRYGVNNNLQCCLYFHLNPSRVNVPIESVIKQNLSLEEKTEKGKQVLVLTLLNDYARNQFSDLILSIVSQARKFDRAVAKSGFITLCNEWFELFEPLATQLSKNDLQGIFAELTFLKNLLTHSRLPINDILSSWKGPYGKGHDFELDDHHYEIKGISEFKTSVTISSEFQLDFLDGQYLFLVVIEFANEAVNQITLTELVGEITTILRANTGTNMNLFWMALQKTGINYISLRDLDQHRFAVKNTTWYDCTDPEFPALKRSKIQDAIRSVKYELALNNLQVHEIENITPFI